MKRLISLALVLVLSLSCMLPALAEDFQLRSGILFGDTIDDVVAKEKKLTRLSEDSNEFQGTVAGYDDVSALFFFNDDDGKLYEMKYSFGSSVCYSKDRTNDIYQTVYNSMRRQYGTPLGNTNGTCHLITGSAFNSMALWVYLLGTMDGCSGDYIDYDEWVVDVEDYHVKIDMVSYYYRDSNYNYMYFVDVSYLKFTDADLDAEIQSKQSEEDTADEDF